MSLHIYYDAKILNNLKKDTNGNVIYLVSILLKYFYCVQRFLFYLKFLFFSLLKYRKFDWLIDWFLVHHNAIHY